MDNCSICAKEITNENAPILTMGGYGIPRYICDECAAQIDVATESENPDEIAEAVESLGKKLSSFDHDGATAETLTEILYSSAKKCKEIREGTYVKSEEDTQDEPDEELLDDIPEEMKESEEDKLLDEKEDKKNKKLEKILNWVSAIIFGAIGAFFIYRLLDLFLF